MIDPFLSLALSVQSNKGVYALLIGSGVARSAGIPTGWDVVLDLIQKLAHLRKEKCEPDAEVWYRETFGREPRYDELLNEVARTPAERRNLLRNYFEPTEEEREQGLKVPQEAHISISELVRGGYVRAIITTNFDRLLEKALEEQDINPTVIMSPDGVRGSLPLVHTDCTVIKVNGDYLDTRIKNTPEELAEYDEAMNRLLDEIFDQFGLIVCGWSADWDEALRRAIERCPSRRFSTYWTSPRHPREEAGRLIQSRQAVALQITDADSFFRDLADRVFSLENLAQQHPLMAKVAAERVKRYIADDRYRIRLHDLVTKETETLYNHLSEERFPMRGPSTEDEFRSRVRQYEVLTEPLMSIMAAGCYWGTDVHETLWSRSLERIACPSFPWGGGRTAMPRLALYPALTLLYSGGVSALAAMKYGTFSSLLLNARCRLLGDHLPLIRGVNNWDVMEERGGLLPGQNRHHTPVSDHLFGLTRDLLTEYLPDEQRYIETFDYFEYLLSLVCTHIYAEQQGLEWSPMGAFTWRYAADNPSSPMNKVESELERLGQEWQPLRFGLFNGSLVRLREIKVISDRLISKQASQWRMR